MKVEEKLRIATISFDYLTRLNRKRRTFGLTGKYHIRHGQRIAVIKRILNYLSSILPSFVMLALYQIFFSCCPSLSALLITNRRVLTFRPWDQIERQLVLVCLCPPL
jgi:hypothetical protein